MKLMHLGKKPAQVRKLVPVDLTKLVVGDEVIDSRNNERVRVVANTHAKVTYQAKRGQYSMLPVDFVRVFCVEEDQP